MSTALYRITGKKEFKWGEEREEAFNNLKDRLTKPLVLTLPSAQDEFNLDTDASNTAIVGKLILLHNEQEKVVAYASYALSPEQRRYCTTCLELLVIVRLTRQFRHYLLGKPFMVRIDHSSLTCLLRFKEPQGQVARWIQELSQYNMIPKYRKGNLHTNADELPGTGVELKDLPEAVRIAQRLVHNGQVSSKM